MIQISKESFGQKNIFLYTLENDHGVSLCCTNYGATITKLIVPDKNGKRDNIVLGFDTLEEYRLHHTYFGATIGRVAGRIANGAFSMNGKTYSLNKNEGFHTLHGGSPSFESRVWRATIAKEEEYAAVHFSYHSPDGENGFPGNVNVNVSYFLMNNNEWKIQYQAETDRITPFDPTNHVFFNLHGDFTKQIGDHFLMIRGEKFAELNADLIPTGNLLGVKGTPFDFQKKQRIDRGFHFSHQQNKLVKGYDHSFVLQHQVGEPDCTLYNPENGRKIETYTDRNAVVVYTANQMDGSYCLQDAPVKPHIGITFETQNLPGSLYHQEFGNILLHPGEKFHSITVYRFRLEG
ncbi:galactose mutarotase [Bacillaceae bacterium Marseille-Q3522]|nr:galactose mutarotase [Bacillaceae bacterium Marseille-Q3522]